MKLTLYMASVSAGFPSPADDFIDTKLDLNEYLIPHPSATFFVRVAGESMIEAGIKSSDILIVDRSLEAVNGSVVIAVLDGELTVKRFIKKNDRVFISPENKQYEPIDVTNREGFAVWGVVTYVVHKL